MNLLFVQPTCDKRGHYGLWTSRLCQALGKTGHNICLFTNKIDVDRYVNELPSFRVVEAGNGEFAFDKFDRCIITRPWYYWYGYFRNTYGIVKRALEFCKNEKFDAIFLTDAEYMTAALIIKKSSASVPPIFWHVQAANFTFDTYPGTYLKKLYKVLQREVFKRVIGTQVKGFAVLGEYHKQALRSQFGLKKSFPIEVVPDGGDVPKNLPDKPTALKAIGIDYNGPLFLFLGMLRKDKGLEYLVEAVSECKAREFRLVIAGAPFDYKQSQMVRMVQQFDVSEKIILRLEYIPDDQLPYYYCGCDAVVFPYSKMYTGSSGPLIKGACTYGKPVIVSNVSEMGRIVRDNKFGLIAEPESPASLSEKMNQFLSLSEQEKSIMVTNAVSVAKKNSWDVIAKKFVDYIEQVVSHR